MSIALTLLISAMQLLTMVQNNPNVSEDFRVYANEVANQAIVVAKDEIAKAQSTTTPVQVPATPTPTVVNNYYTAPVSPTPTGNTNVVVEPYPVEIIGPREAVVGRGGNCGGVSINGITIIYSNGMVKLGDTIDAYYPDGTVKTLQAAGINTNEFIEKYASDQSSWGKFGIVYSTPLTSTTTKILFVKGNLKKEVDVIINPWIVEKDSVHLRMYGDKYVDSRSGNTYNPDTYQCGY